MDRNKLLVVLGMHRSGTSAAMRGLQALGVELGDNLYPPAIDNPTGFWEDNDMLGINLELLSCIGSGTESLGLVNWRVEDTPALQSLRLKAEGVLREKCAQHAVWGFKDPRTARLLPFWQSVFESVGREVLYVIVLRNPISVVESLRKRNEIEPEKAFYLWLEHIVPALSQTAGARRVVVDYDRLLQAPESELSRIAAVLDLPAPEPAALAVYRNEFLAEGLRHSRFSEQDLEQYPGAPSQVVIAYGWLAKLARDSVALEDEQMARDFATISREMEVLAPLLRFVERQDQKLAELRAAGESGARMTSLQFQLDSLQAHNDWMTEQRDAWQKVAGEREKIIAELQAHIQELMEGKAWLASQRDAMAQAAAEHERAIATLQAQLRTLRGRKA